MIHIGRIDFDPDTTHGPDPKAFVIAGGHLYAANEGEDILDVAKAIVVGGFHHRAFVCYPSQRADCGADGQAVISDVDVKKTVYGVSA